MNTERLKLARCFLLDMDGTVYLGERLLPGAKELLTYLDQQYIPYYFITNNSTRSRRHYTTKLNLLGLPTTDEQIITSGEATAIYLNNLHPGARLYVVGTPTLEEELRQHGFALVQKDPDFVVLGFDTTLTYEKIWKLCDFVREGVRYIATHADINCPTEDGYMPDVGAMMVMIAASTGKQPDVVIGKPNSPMVKAIELKTGIPVEDLVMVGDRLYTDIALGKAGIATILVLSGETQREDLPGSPYQPDYIVENLLELYHWLVGS